MLAHQLECEIQFAIPALVLHALAPDPVPETISCFLQIRLFFMPAHQFQRTSSSTRKNSRLPPNQTHVHDAGAPTPARDTLRVSARDTIRVSFQHILFIPVHQLLHEKQFAFPSKSNTPFMLAHLFLHEIQFALPPIRPSSSCQRTCSSTSYNPHFPPL